MDIEYRATASATTTEPFECGACGYVGRGHATAVAAATVARGGLVFGNERADEMARDEADAVAWQEAMSSVAMAPCPRCGAVNRSAWIAWLTNGRSLARLARGVVFLAFGLMALAAASTATDLPSAVCACVLGLLFAVGGPAVAGRPLLIKRRATRRVRFEPPR